MLNNFINHLNNNIQAAEERLSFAVATVEDMIRVGGVEPDLVKAASSNVKTARTLLDATDKFVNDLLRFIEPNELYPNLDKVHESKRLSALMRFRCDQLDQCIGQASPLPPATSNNAKYNNDILLDDASIASFSVRSTAEDFTISSTKTRSGKMEQVIGSASYFNEVEFTDDVPLNISFEKR